MALYFEIGDVWQKQAFATLAHSSNLNVWQMTSIHSYVLTCFLTVITWKQGQHTFECNAMYFMTIYYTLYSISFSNDNI